MFGGNNDEMRWCSTCRAEHERWVTRCSIVRAVPDDPGPVPAVGDLTQIDVADLDLHQWALLDMLLEGTGVRYLLDGPALCVPTERVEDVLSVIEAVQLEIAS